MLKGFQHSIFKKGLCCFVFLISFIFSYSSSYLDRNVHLKISDETSIDYEQIDYSEFSFTSQNHLSESPENPGERVSSFEVEKENENELDDDKDELSDKHEFFEIKFEISLEKEENSFIQDSILFGAEVPLYILFHSWKSFLA